MKNNYKGDRIFPLMFIIIGSVLIISGITLMGFFSSRVLSGIVILLIGTLIVFTREGVVIDYRNQRIKQYVEVFFFKIGKWKNIEDYAIVTLLKINQTSHGYSITGIQFTERKKINRICIINKKNGSQLKIADYKNEKIARLEAEGIAENLKIEFLS